MLLFKYTDPKTGVTSTLEAEHSVAAANHLAKSLGLSKVSPAEARELAAAKAPHTFVPVGEKRAAKVEKAKKA